MGHSKESASSAPTSMSSTYLPVACFTSRRCGPEQTRLRSSGVVPRSSPSRNTLASEGLLVIERLPIDSSSLTICAV